MADRGNALLLIHRGNESSCIWKNRSQQSITNELKGQEHLSKQSNKKYANNSYKAVETSVGVRDHCCSLLFDSGNRKYVYFWRWRNFCPLCFRLVWSHESESHTLSLGEHYRAGSLQTRMPVSSPQVDHRAGCCEMWLQVTLVTFHLSLLPYWACYWDLQAEKSQSGG